MLEMLKSRRSIRKFQEKEIEKEKIDELLKAALLSPSSRSRRPWEFVVVNDKEVLMELSKARGSSSGFLAGAPLGVVVIADKELCDVWVEDSTISAFIMQLTAHSMGLGSCWIQIRERMNSEDKSAGEYIKNILNIPEKYSVECMLAVGYPAEEKKGYDEMDLLYSKIHFNGYNNK